jgi:hypothetical protein
MSDKLPALSEITVKIPPPTGRHLYRQPVGAEFQTGSNPGRAEIRRSDNRGGIPSNPNRRRRAGMPRVYPHFPAVFRSWFVVRRLIASMGCNRQWRNPNHFANCSNFEQSLLKMVTRRRKWSTSAGSGWPRGSSLVVQVSGGALARTSSVNPSIKIKSNFRGNRVDTIFRAGLRALLFFCFGAGGFCYAALRPAPVFAMLLGNGFRISGDK